jgi:hypothetical protein
MVITFSYLCFLLFSITKKEEEECVGHGHSDANALRANIAHSLNWMASVHAAPEVTPFFRMSLSASFAQINCNRTCTRRCLGLMGFPNCVAGHVFFSAFLAILR